MIKVYLLPAKTVEHVEQVLCITLMHDALLETTENPAIRRLIMDTTELEEVIFTASAIQVRDPTPDELDRYHAQVVPYVPDPDTLRAEELLTQSPAVITQPEMWELVRIFGHRLGYRFYD